MHVRPDYDTARAEAGFGWWVGSSQDLLRELTGIPIGEFNLRPEACITAYREGRPQIRERFGEFVGLPGLSTPAVSYGHADALGAELLFPAHGEVCLTHPWRSLEDGLARLAEPLEPATAGWAPFFLHFREELQRAFPGETAAYGCGGEGPLTTAYEMRGEGFWLDLHDRPELTVEFLARLTDSIVEYDLWQARVNGRELPGPAAGMCDDLASVIPPRLFPTLVLPAWDRFYNGLTDGRRSAHVEDLKPEQLPFLEDIGLWSFDPSISNRLNPALLRDRCRVPFTWRLGSFHCHRMTPAEVRDYVYQAAADGASSVHLVLEAVHARYGLEPQVRAFAEAGAEAKRQLGEGLPREALAEQVSPAGRERFWSRWPE
ncbi:MAG: hypothetical protein HYU66_01800 [Armatimonadetes bacterium]|nr:hypothetical protein [Armatimonadota bacterium]